MKEYAVKMHAYVKVNNEEIDAWLERHEKRGLKRTVEHAVEDLTQQKIAIALDDVGISYQFYTTEEVE